MSTHADRGTIHLYGEHSVNHSINIEKKLTIRGYNKATISSPIKNTPLFGLGKELSLISLHFDNINLIRVSPSKGSKTIVIHMCQFTSSTFKIQHQNTPHRTHIFISNSNFTQGGGLVISHSTVIITDSRFERNYASHGGALYADNSYVTITTSKFVNNTASNNGGALFLKRSNVRITNSALKYNTATFGGGMCLYQFSGTITNSTIMSNTA